MTRHGTLTTDDLLILEHLERRGVPLTTTEIRDDVDDVPPRKIYGRLARLQRLGYVDKLKPGAHTLVVWVRSERSRT